MDRRNFVKKGVFAGSAIGAIPAFLASCSEGQEKIHYLDIDEKPLTVLKTLENSFLAVKIFNDGSAEIRDKINNEDWNIGSVAIQDEGPIDLGHCWIRGKEP